MSILFLSETPVNNSVRAATLVPTLVVARSELFTGVSLKNIRDESFILYFYGNDKNDIKGL